MKLREIIEKIDGIIDVKLEEYVEVESFIPITIKMELTKNVVDLLLMEDEDTNLLTYDVLFKELYTNIFKVLYLTDIELNELLDDEGVFNPHKIAEKPELITKLFETYDLLEKYGIIKHINSELSNNDLENIINAKISQKLELYNSTSNTIQQIFQSLPSITDIGNLITTLPKELEDLKNLKILNPNNKSESEKDVLSKPIPKKSKTTKSKTKKN